MKERNETKKGNETMDASLTPNALVARAMKLCGDNSERNRNTFKRKIAELKPERAKDVLDSFETEGCHVRCDIGNKAAYLTKMLAKAQDDSVDITPNDRSGSGMLHLPIDFAVALLREYCAHHHPCGTCEFGNLYALCDHCPHLPCNFCPAEKRRECTFQRIEKCVAQKCPRQSECYEDRKKNAECSMERFFCMHGIGSHGETM